LYRTNTDICACGCQEVYNPPAGRYRARVCAGDGVIFYDERDTEFPANAQYIDLVQVDVPTYCSWVEFELPADQDVIEIELTETGSHSCVDDSDCGLD
jgi:hypothetical protein